MNNVERLDLTIIDPEQSLRPKRNNRQSSGLTNQDEQDEADYQEIMGDDVNSGIEAKLIMKLVCKHGKLACTSSWFEHSLWRLRSNEETLPTLSLIRVSPSRSRPKFHSFIVHSISSSAQGYARPLLNSDRKRFGWRRAEWDQD